MVECPGGESILIDCGSVSGGSIREELGNYAKEFIEERTKKQLDYFIVSHPDRDHMNLAHKVLADVQIKTLLCGGSKRAYAGKETFVDFMLGKFSQREDSSTDFLRFLIFDGEPYSESPHSEASTRLIQCTGGLDVFIVSANVKPANDGGKLKVDLDLPERGAIGTLANCQSVVVCLKYHKHKVLICADATFSTEHHILCKTEWGEDDHLKAYALSGGHHGSADSFSPKFLKAVNPAWVHFSANMKDRFRHPTWEVVKRIKDCPLGQTFGPHGVVIGPKFAEGKELKGEGLFEPPEFVGEVLTLMHDADVSGINKEQKTEWETIGEAAMFQVALKYGFDEATNPAWLTELRIDTEKWTLQGDFAVGHGILSGIEGPDKTSSPDTSISLDESADHHETDDESSGGEESNAASSADESIRLNESLAGEEPKELPPFEYWARWFNKAADEVERLKKLTWGSSDTTWWDWSITDLDLFTSVTDANLGVFWELTIPGPASEIEAPITQQL